MIKKIIAYVGAGVIFYLLLNNYTNIRYKINITLALIVMLIVRDMIHRQQRRIKIKITKSKMDYEEWKMLRKKERQKNSN